MAKRMLIDAAHPEETRVVVLSGHRLEEFDFETSTKKQIKGNIYLAKVTRVEPSLQAAFVEYGGNRHGFLAFGEIHPDYYRIPVADRRAAIEDERVAEAEEDEREERHVVEGESGEVETDIEPDTGEGEDARAEHIAEMAPLDVIRAPESDQSATEEGEEADEEEPLPEPNAAAPDDSDAAANETTRDAETSATAPSPAESASFDSPGFDPAGPASLESAGVAAGGPQGDAFAEDDAVENAEVTSTESPAERADIDVLSAAAPGEEAPALRDIELSEAPEVATPSEDAEVQAEAEAPIPIETLGGDELEEATRRRARPHRHYKIQEVIKRRQIMLVQVTKEERGNKGAALTTYISLAGRYCVLMPNTPRGGGVSRKITSMTDRRRLKDLMSDLDVPEGMGVIVRTAGSERSKAEIKRDFEYLMRLWDEIRELTLKSTAPAMIYEEGNLIKRSIRDLYASDIEEVLVDGKDGYEIAKSFMKMLMPSHAKRVRFYNDPSVPLFHRFQVEGQLDAIHSPIVQLRSGGYIVINPTEALVAIDVNSGRSTRERNIEETALKTNTEAAEEIARQLRLRDLAGLIVIDFIDMEEHRNNGAVERRLKDAMRHDRARIQVGRISPFGLLELSRQRLRPSLLEASTEPCPHCAGTGHIRSTESTALHVLRAIEEEGMRRRSAEISVAVPAAVALYILNQKRGALQQIEGRYGFHVFITEDETLVPPAFRLERVRALTQAEIAALPVPKPVPMPVEEAESEAAKETVAEEGEDETGKGDAWAPQSAEEAGAHSWDEEGEATRQGAEHDEAQPHPRRRRRRRRRSSERGRETAAGGRAEHEAGDSESAESLGAEQTDEFAGEIESGETANESLGAGERSENGEASGETGEHRRRRRGRRGGRRRRRNHETEAGPGEDEAYGMSQGEGAVAEDALAQGEAMAAGPAEEGELPLLAPEHATEGEVPMAPEPVAPEPIDPEPEARFVAPAPQEAEIAPVSAEPQAASPAAPEAAETPVPTEETREEEAEPEAARSPAAYNMPEAQEISGPVANPRRGWWRRR